MCGGPALTAEDALPVLQLIAAQTQETFPSSHSFPSPIAPGCDARVTAAFSIISVAFPPQLSHGDQQIFYH